MNQEQKNLKVFGYGLAIILGFVAWRLLVKAVPGFWPTLLSATGIFLALMTLIDYQYLKPIYSHWMKVALGIGLIVSTVVLSVVFFLIFGVVGIVLRLLRKDILAERREPNRESYWIQRDREAFQRERYKQQF